VSGASDTRVDPFRPGTDDAEALGLRAEVWGADHPHSHPAFFRWLFGAGNPAGPGSGVMLRRAGRLVGFAGLCPRLAQLGGTAVRVAHGLDYMVSPGVSAAASGRFALRVAADWATFARQGGYDFGINFPNANSRRLLTSDRLGWQPVLAPALMVRPLAAPATSIVAGGAVRRLALRFGLGVGAGALAVRAAATRGRAAGAVRAVDLGSAADAALIDALWHRVAAVRDAGLLRDAAALRWRYGQHPLYRYRMLGWQDGDRMDALVITAQRHLFGMDCLLVVDALIDPGRPAAAARLVGDAIRASGAALAVAQAVPGHDLAGALRRAGFLAVPERFNPKPFQMVALPLAVQARSGALPASTWQFGWGDMDVV